MNGIDTGPGKLAGSIRIRCGFRDNTHGFIWNDYIIGHAGRRFLAVKGTMPLGKGQQIRLR
ncbi:hypothetical protein [Rhizobium ruizarguesonis]|uniref:hypothetical protein n=1 Tax=Rhizobium ruizarguesonis TaxID=2081791 RepID=UPI001FD083DD|nr:hypothetical protein [Rhizobium ruizarguesonis]